MTRLEELVRHFDGALQEIAIAVGEAGSAGSRSTGMGEIRLIPEDDIGVAIPPEALGLVVTRLVTRSKLQHLTTITAIDVGEHVHLQYHFWRGHGLTVETALQADDLTITTITDTIPGAAFYEREIHDMFGVHFNGHADLRPLLLPDNWQGGPPLLKGEDDD